MPLALFGPSPRRRSLSWRVFGRLLIHEDASGGLDIPGVVPEHQPWRPWLDP